MKGLIDHNKLLELKNKKGADKMFKNRSAHQLDYKDVEIIIQKLQDLKKSDSKEEIAVLIAGLMQTGGSNQGAKQKANFEYGDLRLSALELEQVINQVKPEATIRQLARVLANEIANIGILFELEGDLATQMKREHPDLTNEEAAWCSNFQTANPNCPERVKAWLNEDVRNRR